MDLERILIMAGTGLVLAVVIVGTRSIGRLLVRLVRGRAAR